MLFDHFCGSDLHYSMKTSFVCLLLNLILFCKCSISEKQKVVIISEQMINSHKTKTNSEHIEQNYFHKNWRKLNDDLTDEPTSTNAPAMIPSNTPSAPTVPIASHKPSTIPTIHPTRNPTVSFSPTTIVPTQCPTISLKPSCLPTHQPTAFLKVIPTSEYSALYDLYNSTSGAEWTWKSDEVVFGTVWNFTGDHFMSTYVPHHL